MTDAAILKRATRRAVEAVGGLERAALVVAVGKSQLHRCTSQHHDDTLTLRDAAAIDEVAMGSGGGVPPILAALAALLGHVALPVATAPSDHEDVAQQLMTVTAELGDVAAEWRDALRDGTVRQREARRVVEQIDEMLGAGHALRALVQAIAWPVEGGGVSTALDTNGVRRG